MDPDGSNENVQFLAVVTNVKTKTTAYSNYEVTRISEVTVKYVDPSKGSLSALCFMEDRDAGQIVGGADATETTFTDKKDFKANSHGGDVKFERLFKKRMEEKWKKPQKEVPEKSRRKAAKRKRA